MASNIKHTQLTRVGYTYQDLVCIKLLVDWFHNPNKYQWVCIEGFKSEKRGFKGLDDVIALDQNGLYELIQVKFTIDSERDDLRLSFDWLLNKTGRGTSFLQKWEQDVARYSADSCLSVASLKTNRVPDNELGKCLCGNKIDFNAIPSEYLKKIQDQLGGYDRSKSFFDIFIFDHSLPEIDNLENKLHDSLVPDHATAEGWLRLLKAVEKWATRQDEPSFGGRITIDHIREILTKGITRSISQQFEVPQGYVPPSDEFHSNILEKTLLDGCWIVSGLPGMGKSTYLSYLTDTLTEQGSPVIRHHYSLSAQSVIDRISYTNAARSLQNQLQILLPTTFASRKYEPEELDEWILSASDEFTKLNKKLTVIIDGLDHVARERSDITQLEHLINRLIPLSEKICLILGTQPVSDTYLPARMISDVPKETNWLSLPSMELKAIKCWLDVQLTRNKITLRCAKENSTEEIVGVAEALHNVSGGYPLHLIYSVKSLMLNTKYLSKYDIEKLPACPDGDIHNYYKKLWSSLSPSAREILLLVACVEFSWPDKNSIGFCFENSLHFVNAFDEVQHLIEKRRIGIVPFHGSVLVFLRNRQEYQNSFNGLLLKVKKWIQQSAPEYWRWGWEWIIDAKLGNSDPLINGITRDWSENSFCKGYPLQHIEHIISTAEKFALELDLLPNLVDLRLIKIRLINGPEFQLQEDGEFLKLALKLNPDSYGMLWYADNIRFLDDEELSIVASIYRDLDGTVAEDCFNEVIRRLQFYAKVEDRSQYSKIESLIYVAIDVLVDVNNQTIDVILDFLKRLNNKEKFFVKILDKLIEVGNGYLILEIPHTAIPKGFEFIYWNYFVLVCCKEGVELADRKEREKVILSDLGVVSLIMAGHNVSTEFLTNPSTKVSNKNITYNIFYKKFFYSLANQLELEKKVSNPVDMSASDADSFIIKAEAAFEYVAFCIAKKFKNDGCLNIFEIYEYIDAVKLHKPLQYNYEMDNVRRSLSESLIQISLDLNIVLISSCKHEDIKTISFESIAKNEWWNLTHWLECAATKAISNISNEVPEHAIYTTLSALKKRKDSTSTLATDSLELAKLAFHFDLNTAAIQCLKLSAQHVLGYGYRKDTTFSELYDAISTCSEYKVGDIADWLKRVAPFTNDMFDFTEREIRHIPGWYINLLAEHYPERLVDEFDYHLMNQNWSIAFDILESFVKYFSLTTPSEQALLKCLTSHEALVEFEKRAENDPKLVPLYEAQLAFLGGVPPPQRERVSSSSMDEKSINIELDAYPPEMLTGLIDELQKSGIYSADKFFDSWILYWDEKKCGLEVIDAFERVWNENVEFPYRVHRCLDSVFSLSHKLQGATKAYQWAVRSIRTNSHWSRWSGSRATKYLNKYARIYSTDWKKLLVDTIQGDLIKLRGDEWGVVPTSQLVSYLLAAGQPTLACKITEVMLKSLESEIAHLPISPLHWYEKSVPFDQISARILLLYYKWPDRLARLKTTKEIASLLDNHIDFRKLYLDQLNKLNYETEITDYLSVLLLTKSKIYTLEELMANITYPSILSDEMLRRLGFEVNQEISSYYSKKDAKYEIDEYSFEKAKNGLAPVFFIMIEELGDRIQYPLSQCMSHEWNKIRNRKKVLYFDPYDFCGDQFYRQDKISCSFSSQVESVVLSAYLRTLAFAYDNFDISYEVVSSLAFYSAATGGLCSTLLPSSKPIDWPNVHSFEKGDELPTESDLIDYLNCLINSEEVVLRANGPIVRKISGVNCDLEVMVVHANSDISSNAKSAYKTLEGAKMPSANEVRAIAIDYHPTFLGRWEVDWLLRGYSKPDYSFGSLQKLLSIKSNTVEYLAGEVKNATWQYWTHNWYPASYRGIGPSIGTYLSTSNEIWNHLRDNTDGYFFLLGKLTVLDKRGFSSDCTVSEIYAIKNIDNPDDPKTLLHIFHSLKKRVLGLFR